jgi:2-methylisocitrate lyase-like PEP mutase family enzyme
MGLTQTQKAQQFQALHRRPGGFLFPNPWDPGSARILTGLGFEALATSSAASAAAQGLRDGRLGREGALAHCRAIVLSTPLPVAADLENGFSDTPAGVAETVRLAAEAGLVGCSIEDATRDREKPLHDIRLAAERIQAAAEAAHSLPLPFTLTARAETFISRCPDLDETLERLTAYEKAGADVLFAPGLPDLAAVKTVCSALSKPVNFMVGIRGRSFTVAELVQAGVKRISFASSFYRAAMTALIGAANEAKGQGTFTYLDTAILASEINGFLPD